MSCAHAANLDSFLSSARKLATSLLESEDNKVIGY